MVDTPTTVALENTFVKVSSRILVADWHMFVAWQSPDLDRFTPASAPFASKSYRCSGVVSVS